ncbi:T9SS type A sorting domain-containing protein [uncultured Mucilaginibacter sp.]|uniref:T9SS type A sorting domain-containing protein n=1 Tax=uncultured Mucilaginibacter sp. TaxID=797541 RepID=UPI00263141AD|nr:T9SS type A sorting domain-containing protein [uncultured Mucilaginibacter sp.]
MKKLLLYLLALVCATVQAQTQKNYTQTADSCMSNLNKSNITTGIFYDRVYPFSGLSVFNDNYADTSSNSHYLQGYNELYNAAYSTNSMVAPDNYLQQVSAKLQSAIVPIGILNYRFNYLDTTAIQNNLISTSGLLLYDVPNRPSSPYRERLLSLAAVLTDSIRTSTAYFELSSSLYLNNTGNTISNVNVDFADGSGLHQLSLGQGISITYPSIGVKIIHYYINYTNGTQVETYSSVYVSSSQGGVGTLGAGSPPPCNGFGTPDVLPIVADISYQGYENESSPINGHGTEFIVYHTNACDRVLRKPIIIINGFDPGSQNQLPFLYKNLMYNNGANNFGDEMLAKGYDIIYLFFPGYFVNGKQIDGGSDYIQRNAFTLIKLIQTVNQILQQNGSTEKLVIVGPSMGGLISRYALTYMEHNNMSHNTRLWVSFDSPHLGANIPIGDQWTLDYLGNTLGLSPAKTKLNSTINTPAAKEMLLHHYLTGNETPTPYSTRNTFMQELNTLGYPTQLRKIALINGAGNGLTQGNFGGLALHMAAQPTTIVRILSGAAAIFIPVKTLFLVAIKIFTGGVAAVNNTIDLNTYFTPGTNGRNKVFSGSVLALFLRRDRYSKTLANSIGLDNSAGGFYNAQQQIADGFTVGFTGSKRLFVKPKIYTIIPNHSFIPAKSSLAVTNGSNYGEDFSNRNLVTSAETPFNSYFTPNANEIHVSLTACSAQWLSNEIDNRPQAPVISTKYAITGSNSICNSQNYTVNGTSTGNITWTASPSNLANITISNNVATLTPTGNGAISLSAVVPTACGNVTVSYPVTISTSPTVTSISATMSGSCRSGGYQDWLLQATPSNPNATNWRWTASNLSSGSTITFQSPNSSSTYATVHGGGGANITYTDPCGNTATSGVTIYSPCGTGSRVASYPNPADQQMTVDYQTASDSSNPAATSDASTQSKTLNTFSVELYNDKGKVLKSGKSANGKGVVLNTADILNGNYFLHVKDGKELIEKQVIIQHQ